MSTSKNTALSPRRGKAIKELRLNSKNYFLNKKLSVSKKYPYILSSWHDWPENIVDNRVVEYINNVKEARRRNKEPFPLHKYLHHGLSSQAMLFNLLGPLVVGGRFDVIDEILKIAGVKSQGKVTTVEFEIEDREVFNEKQAQPTSVDLVIYSDAGEKYFCEFKFTEAEFGGCSLFFKGDCDGRNPSEKLDICILHDAGRRYWELMENFKLITPMVKKDSRCPFVDLYQAYRVTMFSLEKNGDFILIYDERNPAFYVNTSIGARGVYARFLEYLPKSALSRCHHVSTQQVFNIISNLVKEEWVQEVGKKYF